MKNSNTSNQTTVFYCRPNHFRVKTPWRHASDRVIARIGAALHTLDHQFSKSRERKNFATKKLRTETAMLTASRDPSQGGLLLEDTPQVGGDSHEQLIRCRRGAPPHAPRVNHHPFGRREQRGAEQ